MTRQLQRPHGAGYQLAGHGTGEVPCQRGGVQRLPLLLGVVGQIHHRRLQTGEAHIQLRAGHMGPRQLVFAAGRLLCQLVHRSAAGIGQSQHTGSLVEALPRRVVPRGAQHRHVRIVLHVHNEGVSAGDGQRHKGRLQFRERQIVGGDMTPHMVDGDQRHTQRIGGGFGKGHPHQHRADETGRVRHRHSIDVLFRQARVRQRLVRQGGDSLHMLAGGDLRHHAAVQGVHIRLGQNRVGQHLPSIPHHGHRRLVAGGFKGQYVHCAASSV